jgi:hypothetical protein
VTAPAVRAPVDVTFRATGVDGVRRGLKLIGGDAELTHQRVGGAARQIAGGVEAIARTGKASGEALKQIISQGAEMAFMFGAGGSDRRVPSASSACRSMSTSRTGSRQRRTKSSS